MSTTSCPRTGTPGGALAAAALRSRAHAHRPARRHAPGAAGAGAETIRAAATCSPRSPTQAAASGALARAPPRPPPPAAALCGVVRNEGGGGLLCATRRAGASRSSRGRRCRERSGAGDLARLHPFQSGPARLCAARREGKPFPLARFVDETAVVIAEARREPPAARIERPGLERRHGRWHTVFVEVGGDLRRSRLSSTSRGRRPAPLR